MMFDSKTTSMGSLSPRTIQEQLMPNYHPMQDRSGISLIHQPKKNLN